MNILECDKIRNVYATVSALVEQGDLDRALVALRGLVADDPDLAMAHNDLAVMLKQSGFFEEALQHQEQALSIEPTNVAYAVNLADLHITGFKNYDSAIKIYLKLLDEFPCDVKVLSALGKASVDLERSDEAKTFYLKVLALEPWNCDAREYIARQQQPTEKSASSDVLERINRAISRDHPNHPEGIQESPAIDTQKGSSDYYSFARPEIEERVPSSARRVLDVGCAAGMLGARLKKERDAEVWGIEINSSVAEEAARRLDRVIPLPVEQAICELPDRYFDVIICADVLEHLIDPWQALARLAGKLSDDGALIASIPNIGHWSVLLSLLQGDWNYEDAGLLDKTHLRFFTRRSVEELFSRAGLEISDLGASFVADPGHISEKLSQLINIEGIRAKDRVAELNVYQYLVSAIKKAPVKLTEKETVAGSAGDVSKFDRKEPDTGLVSIVILTFNLLELTRKCVESIQRHTPQQHEIIFVDNGSTDGTVAWLQEQARADSRITIIENRENRGFAAGCNQGIRAAEGEFVLLLNNDTLVTPGWLAGMRDLLDRYPYAGIVGPMTNSASGVQVIADPGYLTLDELPAWATAFRENFRYRIIPQRRIVGFCMLFRRQLVETIGLLDESFGSGNFEDDDFCLRAELSGYHNMIAGDVFVHHAGGATFAVNRINYAEAMMQNMALFRNKWDYNKLDEATLRRLIPLDAIQEARRLAMRDEMDKSIELLMQNGIRVAPDNSAPYIELAEILMAAGRHDDALQVLPEMPPTTDRGLLCEIEAICLASLGNNEAARQSADKAQDRPRALVVLGTLAARGGDLAGAEALFRRAIEVDPSSGSGWLSLGMLLWGKGKQEDAWQAVKRSAVVDPLNGDAVKILRDMAERVELISEAEKLIGAAAQTYPYSRNLVQHHAAMLAQCGQKAEALETCESFLVNFGLDNTLLPLALELRNYIGVYDRLAVGGTESITLCMIVKDEARNLAACLASVKPVVHEMIVVDTGSSDRTVDIAIAFGARVGKFPWNGNFSDARNYAIEQAKGAWILVMDADEVLSKQDLASIGDTLTSPGRRKRAWSVLTRNYTRKVHAQGWISNDGAYPREERADGWHPSWKVRLFPNRADIRFSGEVHEMVESSLLAAGYLIKKAPIVVHHYGGLEEDKQQVAEKRRRYFDSGMQKLKNNPDDVIALIELAVQAGEIGYFEDAIGLWDRVLQLSPGDVEALFNKGYALIGLRRYEEALNVTAQVLDLVPDHKEAAFNYATCSLYAGSPEQGIAVAAEHSRRNPDYPPLCAVLAALSLAVGDSELAQQAAGRLHQFNYAIDDYIRDRADILDRLGRSTLAERLRQGWPKL